MPQTNFRFPADTDLWDSFAFLHGGRKFLPELCSRERTLKNDALICFFLPCAEKALHSYLRRDIRQMSDFFWKMLRAMTALWSWGTLCKQIPNTKCHHQDEICQESDGNLCSWPFADLLCVQIFSRLHTIHIPRKPDNLLNIALPILCHFWGYPPPP